jgi:putative transposase
MARRLRVSSAGVPEHLIQKGKNRQAIFACEEDMQAYVGWLKTYSKINNPPMINAQAPKIILSI